MASPEVNRLMDNARVHLPGALDNAMQRELFNVLDEFFKGSGVWLEDIVLTTTAGDQVYDIVSTAGTIIRISQIGDANLIPINGKMEIPGVLELQNDPGVQTLTVRVVLSCIDPVTRDGYPIFPQWVLQKYGRELTDGLVGLMMMQKAKPYSDPTLGPMRLRRFRAGISRAKVDLAHGNLRGGQAWRYPQGFASRKRR